MAESIPEGAADSFVALLVLAARHGHVVISQVFQGGGPIAGAYRLSLCEDEPDGLDTFAQGDHREIADRLAKNEDRQTVPPVLTEKLGLTRSAYDGADTSDPWPPRSYRATSFKPAHEKG